MGKTKKQIIAPLEFFGGGWVSSESSLIGTGSFGRVFLANKKGNPDFFSAIKVITIPQNVSEIQSARTEGMSEAEISNYFEGFVKSWEKEIKLMDALKGCTNIVSIEDHEIIPKQGQIGWDIHIRMELLTSFVSYCEAYRLPERCILKLGIDLCTALEYCQKEKVIHRDIKPENIFISQHCDFKLGDFGIARHLEKTTSGLTKAGTFNFMAPEVYRAEPYGPTVDIYSLGLVLYRSLNDNRLPFLPPHPEQIFPDHRSEALEKRMNGAIMSPPRNASPEAADVILKACSYNPRDRFQTPTEFREALQKIYNTRTEKKMPDEFVVIDPDMTVLLSNETQILIQNDGTAVSENVTEGDNPCPPPPKPKLIQTDFESQTSYHRRRKKRRLITALAASLVLLIASAVFVYGAFFSVPDLVYLPATQAAAQLDAKNMAYVRQEVYSDDIQEGIVISQELNGGVIQLLVSKGPEFRPVPSLLGLAREEAEGLLSESGFACLIEYVVDTNKEPGRVFEQSIEPHQLARHGDAVVLSIYTEADPVEVPELKNMSKEEAIALLDALDLLSSITEIHNEALEGTVVSQQPQAYDKLLPGDVVQLIVSKGPEEIEPDDPLLSTSGSKSSTSTTAAKVQVPSVVNLSRSEASNRLTSAGFDVQFTEVYHSSIAAGIVIEQSPSSGSMHVKGTVILVTVSRGAQQVQVPSVVGMTRSQAQDALSQAGLSASFSEEISESIGVGIVIRQSPSSGYANRNSTVSVVVSKGNGKSEIPNVVGMSESNARSVMQSAGMQVSTQYEHSNSYDRNTVMQQSATGEALPGTTVTITISRGTADSGWLDGNGSNIDTSQYNLEMRTLYQSRSKEEKSFTSQQGGEWTLVSSSESWSDWKNNGTSSVSSSSTRDVKVEETAAVIRTVYQYYHYCSSSGQSSNAKLDSGRTLHTEIVTSQLSGAGKNTGGVQMYSGSTCSNNTNKWYSGADSYSPLSPKALQTTQTVSAAYKTYYYRDKTTTYIYWRWSSWSDWSTSAASASSSVEVNTKTQYRYSGR